MSRTPRSLRVLHLASFAGNIGDLANHAGARGLLARNLDVELSFVELEIREFYWRLRSFDDDFVRYANGFDLLMIGGGNYFELWVQDSATGTSINIEPARFAALRVPVVFYALGVDTGQGYTESTANRFRAFMGDVLSRDDVFTCVRNDGSTRALQEVLGTEAASRIPMMPDGGFFAADHAAKVEVGGLEGRRIGINIAGDMLDRRFEGDVSADDFLAGLARTCSKVLASRDDVTLELVPHIWRDLTVISSLLALIPDKYLRRRVSVAPLLPVRAGLTDFLARYAACDLVLGMRFHANVCPIGMLVPSLGLLCYPQVAHLYDELGLADRLVDVRARDFQEALFGRVADDLDDLQAIGERNRAVMEQVRSQADATVHQLGAWLVRRFG